MTVDSEDASLAHIGYAIYALLEQVAILRTDLSDESENTRTVDLIVNESDRFKIWSSSVGLLIPGHGSLDYRVREAESLSKTFRSFLTDLQVNLDEVLATGLYDQREVGINDVIAEVDTFDDVDDDEEEEEDINSILNILLQSIQDIIDRLYRLATKLRSPVTRLRSSRAQKFQILDDGVNLFQCFGQYDYDFVSSLFRHYREGCKLADTTEDVVSPERRHKSNASDEPSEYLIERIALANVARRRQFAYWRHHRLKLDKHTEAAIVARQVPKSTTTSSHLPAPVKPAPTMTVSSATQLLNPTRDFGDLVSMVSVSEYTPLPAEEHGDSVNFPHPPYVAAGSKFFECPYCFTTCARKTVSLKAWRAHLIHDVRPYICTHENCKTPDQLYDNKSDWIQHETTNHTPNWKSSVHPEVLFVDFMSLRLHATDGHIQRATMEANSQQVTEMGSLKTTSRSCPVCAISNLPPAQLNEHIAAHLERMAMFSLPKGIGSAETESDGRDSDEANDEEDTRGLDMSSDLDFSNVSESFKVRGQDDQSVPLEKEALTRLEAEDQEEMIAQGAQADLSSDSSTLKGDSAALPQSRRVAQKLAVQRAFRERGKQQSKFLETQSGDLQQQSGASEQLRQKAAMVNAEIGSLREAYDTQPGQREGGSKGKRDNRLQAAAANGDEEVVQILLASGVNVDARGNEGNTALQLAAHWGHEKTVRILLEAGANVNAERGRRGTALEAASGGNHEKIVQMLLDAGADLSSPSALYGDALHVASGRGHKKIVQELLNAGADVHAGQGSLNGGALQEASARGHEEIVRILLNAGAKVNTQPSGTAHENALSVAAHGGHSKVVQMLLDAGADVNAGSTSVRGEALQQAAAAGHEEVVRILLNSGADVNLRGPGGYFDSALAAAASRGHERLVQLLLDAGADTKNTELYSKALQGAARSGREKVVATLLNRAERGSARKTIYNKALGTALDYGHHNVVRMLLRAGAEISTPNVYSDVLIHACKHGDEELVETLLERDLDVGPRIAIYNKAFDAALAFDQKKVVQMLFDARAGDPSTLRGQDRP